jgi:hypothetical protein
MPRSKTHVSKLPGDLRDPMEFGRPSLCWTDAEVTAWIERRWAFIATEQLRKLGVLLRELGAPPNDFSQPRLLWLSIELAKKLYPGFCTELDGAKPKGRPRRGKGAGAGAFEDPTQMLLIVEILRDGGKVNTDFEACKILAQIDDEELASPARKTALEKKAKALATIVSTTRANAKRRAAGKIH